MIVYGGVVAGVARFSKLSDRMFSFQIDKKYWTEIFYPRTPLRDAYIPRERAFHSTTIVGNYLIVFGGYSHRHNKEEICYDNQMYLYHLGCHTWINQDVLGANKRSRYPKQQGVFAHAASLRNKNTLLIVGGYHGNVNGDLLAYTLPPMFVVRDDESFDPESACPKHLSVTECLADPECGWCSADGVCYGRTIGANCTTNLQTTRCPGICPALGDCHSCLIHGSESENTFPSHSVALKLGLGQCTWCVQNARCHHKDDNYGVCGEDTPSQIPGWWGVKGTEISKAEFCTEQDRRPGLTFIKYLHPINWTMPDHVTIVNATMVDFNIPSSTTHTEQTISGEMVARLLGFIRPPASWTNADEKLHVCASYSQAVLKLGTSSNLDGVKLAANITAEQTQCTRANWQSLEPVRVIVDFQAKRTLGIGSYNHHQHSKMGLQHNKSQETPKAFTFEYLEPYSNGTCHLYMNCMHCLSDSLCGWCELTSQCFSRLENETAVCVLDDNWKYLTLQPSQCSNCSNYISCEKCIDSGLCEWWAEDARCARKGRSEAAVREISQCPIPCNARENCSACLDERGRCVWCEATQQCFSFSVYTSEYQFGLCREWIDQVVPLVTQNDNRNVITGDNAPQQKQQCKSCSTHTNCTSCLRSLGCGWCFDRDYPIEGVCMQGDFNRSMSDCGLALNTTAEEAEWAYAQCPDVDECGLGLHDCHKEAKCTNTHGSFNCHCRRGFVGDGRISCVRTCYETCINGYCDGAPNYKCKCNLGWTGPDCSINCLCNNHSTCEDKIGKCDKCQNWTEGEFCERCRPGSYGNATSIEGCKPCECNGHGNAAFGICDVQTGECFCQDNTVGLKCELCNREYYGDPRDGGQCYYQCAARGLLKNIGKQGIGSYQSHKSNWGISETRECLWIISPHSQSGVLLSDALIQFKIEKNDLNVTCGENAVYVYDGLPDLTGNTQQSQLLAVFCTQDGTPKMIEARSGHITVHYKQGSHDQGFNAMYSVHSCSSGTCYPPRHCDEKGRCVCGDGYSGPQCIYQKCPGNCSFSLNQGHCDTSYGRCLCSPGYGGGDCSVRVSVRNAVITELFNSQLLNENFEHLRKTLPRFGHSLITDKRGSLWMFGGYSLSHGPLNDIRQFDTKNNTWIQVTVESTPEAKMPDGRYFHAAEILHSKQIIYIYGGLTGQGKGNFNPIIGDFWQFSLQNQRWDLIEIDSNRPPQLAGHTLTLVRNLDKESLILIGGFSTSKGLNNEIWEFNLDLKLWNRIKTTGSFPIGIYGHSTVFHTQTQILYVFGGFTLLNDNTQISNKLYALHYPTLSWTELPTFYELNRPSDNLPRARFLHSAITTESFMVIYGGRTHPLNSTDIILAYIYKCNQWVRLTEDVEVIGNLPPSSYAQAMTYDAESGAIYIVGGWDGSSKSRVTRIDLPSDLCELWSSRKYLCRHFMGCSYCSVQPIINDDSTHCYSIGRNNVCNPINGTLLSNRGISCDSDWILKRNCSSFQTCTSCLASWLSHSEKMQPCRWCETCANEGKCIFSYSECGSDDCNKTAIENVDRCPALQCPATDCESCEKLEMCSWANNRTHWLCVSNNLIEENNLVATVTCPMRCSSYTNCSSCLTASTSEGGFEDCRWSTQLNECISPSFQPLYCVGGVCGLVLSPDEIHYCPEPCNSYNQCATCLKHAHCGWCAKHNTEGDGICTEGSLESPAEYPAASTCDIIYMTHNNLTEQNSKGNFSWKYVECPAENECVNNHHNCNPKSERCVDLEIGYKCVCGDGYKLEGKECIPVCTQGCVRGNCVEPNVCNCDFGYVGANCSIQCQCNGHSECRGPDKLNECLECHNNTIGEQCERCKPLFVGDPKNNGECIPCQEYCNGHSDVCVHRNSDVIIKNMTRIKLEKYLSEGPLNDAICLRCDNRTDGDRCETCISGHFRGSENNRDVCRPCECHGHGDTCDPITGEKCNCGNNTESDGTCSSNSKNSQQCWMVQCSKCKDSYAGNPIDGHQCYKQITVESKMCFDAKTIDECKVIPTSLKPGQTVFFVVQPRFMNVDIRIIVDVTQGELDLFMSPQEDSFVVLNNETIGQHEIFLDNRYTWFPLLDPLKPVNVSPLKKKNQNFPYISDCSTVGGVGFIVKDQYAHGLSTYVTLTKCNTLLRVYGLKNRLVITLPQNAHNLSATRFFMALRASASSYGLVFFRQDQLHIDLFVFFSVFFSCFFLFLAVCVVAWKAKQAADVRRARRRHVVEMLHMAKRPFASVLLLIGPSVDSPPQNRRRKTLKQSNVQHGQHSDVRPVAIEPTSDGVASVSTVFIRLPGKHKSPISLALASSLTTMSRSFPSSGRAFLRHRGSNQVQIPPTNNVNNNNNN